MSLTKIKGNTYYYNAPTNCGVYAFKDKYCLLIDSGINNSQGKKFNDLLIEAGLKPKYIINTHSHADHCGANFFFKENYPNCSVYASSGEKVMMENPFALSAALFSFEYNKALDITTKVNPVDNIIDFGENKINDEKFEIISLKGHSVNQIGVITPEKVCFLGDSLFSGEILSKYSFPYIINIEDEIETLKYIKTIDADYFVMSHSESVIAKEEVCKICDCNMDNINNYISQILELLEQPLSREGLLENIIILNDLHFNSYHQYHIYLLSLSAFLSYLCNKNEIDFSLENGNVYYFKKS